MLKRAITTMIIVSVYAFSAFSEEVHVNVIESYQKDCDLNNGLGCSNLGFSYARGRGVKQDFVKAKEYYQKACDLNNGTGCNNLGLLYYKGKGLKNDATLAKKYFSKGCDLKFQQSCDYYLKLIFMGY